MINPPARADRAADADRMPDDGSRPRKSGERWLCEGGKSASGGCEGSQGWRGAHDRVRSASALPPKARACFRGEAVLGPHAAVPLRPLRYMFVKPVELGRAFGQSVAALESTRCEYCRHRNAMPRRRQGSQQEPEPGVLSQVFPMDFDAALNWRWRSYPHLRMIYSSSDRPLPCQ
jgi:hypothetical protein